MTWWLDDWAKQLAAHILLVVDAERWHIFYACSLLSNLNRHCCAEKKKWIDTRRRLQKCPWLSHTSTRRKDWTTGERYLCCFCNTYINLKIDFSFMHAVAIRYWRWIPLPWMKWQQRIKSKCTSMRQTREQKLITRCVILFWGVGESCPFFAAHADKGLCGLLELESLHWACAGKRQIKAHFQRA